MELEVVKVEEGLCDGRVLFHSHVSKTPQERAALQQRKETEVQLKDARRKQQVHRPPIYLCDKASLKRGVPKALSILL